MHPKHLLISDFTYDLPHEKIAAHPLHQRDRSKILIYKNGEIKEDIYKNIADHLPKDSFLIFNNTKVIPARVLFKKETGGIIEIFCLEPYEEEYNVVMNKTGAAEWKCMIGGASKWNKGPLKKMINIKGIEVSIAATLTQKLPDAYVTEFSWQPSNFSFAEIIDAVGEIPLPPYIKRASEETDKERYQTIYAEHRGSVAAPTAGLHFTEHVFSSLKNKNINTDHITLHVGAGTFKPVRSETIQEHEMHAEWMDVSISFLKNLQANINNNIVAVGTTSLRTIESLYWMGVKSYLNINCTLQQLEIKQWEVYEEPLSTQDLSLQTALEYLIKWIQTNDLQRLFIKTQILIAPEYIFKIATALVTNFHQPGSTLLLLVAAITKDWKKIYDHALQNDYRFLSYGDGCLLFLQ
jgi:S-adenosylmethionine:tRNA ribosyltransferase-isomerase